MRLLHTTRLEVVSFDADLPTYSILSHTWEDEEITLRDLERGRAEGMKGYPKLQNACALAASQGYDYIWIDTCCIDKTSSAELSEAINSMFRWYRDADVCYAFLSDVSSAGPIADYTLSDHDNIVTLREVTLSRWFTRGWTLQELIAPKAVHFYNQNWLHLGSKDKATKIIQAATGIPPSALLSSNLTGICSHQRMQWAAARRTTRPEDMAYCMLGIFDVNMSLLYGEGKKKAFRRLQEEIVKSSTDLSIFLWTVPANRRDSPDLTFRGLFAEDPTWFDPSGFKLGEDSTIMSLQDPSITVTNKGTSVNWSVMPVLADRSGTIFVAMLIRAGHTTGGIIIQKLDFEASQFCRVAADMVIWVERESGVVSDRTLLGGIKGLMASSAGSPRTFSMLQDIGSQPLVALDAIGFSFSNQECLTVFGSDAYLCHVRVMETTSSFHLEGNHQKLTWLAHVQQDLDQPEDTEKLGQSVVVGALSVEFERFPFVPPHCLVVGYDMVRRTVLNTKTTFVVPWVAWCKDPCQDPERAKKAVIKSPGRRVTEISSDHASVDNRPMGFASYAHNADPSRTTRVLAPALGNGSLDVEFSIPIEDWTNQYDVFQSARRGYALPEFHLSDIYIASRQALQLRPVLQHVDVPFLSAENPSYSSSFILTTPSLAVYKLWNGVIKIIRRTEPPSWTKRSLATAHGRTHLVEFLWSPK
ncbi:hypothetical protein ACJ41O_001216 [Fusarium nematophilum]